MTATLQTPRTTVKRLPKRGAYDRVTVEAIVDEALICHVGFVVDGQPVVIPTIHWRGGEELYFHGSAASRMLRSLKGGIDACVTVTLLDGLVLARSAFHHSMNYRSVVVFGKAREVTDPAERATALDSLVEHVCALCAAHMGRRDSCATHASAGRSRRAVRRGDRDTGVCGGIPKGEE